MNERTPSKPDGKAVIQVSAEAAHYESLVMPHLEDLRKYCFYLTKSKWDGEDLYQEALLRSMVYFREHEPYRDLRSFLIRVARNLWIDGCRTRQRQRRLSPHAFPASRLDSDYAEVRGWVEWMGERLPARNVEMLLLSDYYGYSMQEIAEACATTVPAVKSILFRTRSLIRQSRIEKAEDPARSRVLRLDAERWSQAIMRDLPPVPAMRAAAR